MIAAREHKPLGQLLVTRGLVREEHVERALEEQRRSNHQKLLGEVLVELQICSEEQITEALAEAYGVPYARVSPRIADPKILGMLPRDFIEKHTVLPLYLVDGTLTVAVAEPANVFLVEEIERLLGHPIQVVAATARDIRATLAAHVPGEDVFVHHGAMEEVRPEEFAVVDRPSEQPVDVGQIASAGGESPVVKLVDYCIYTAVRDGATDVHIEPGENALRVRFRIDGRLTERLRPPAGMRAAIAARIKVMAGLDADERRLPQEGAIRVRHGQRNVDLHVSTMPGKYGETVVLHVVGTARSDVSLERLGFGYDTLKQWRKLIGLPNGLLLVTGPAGNGQTSTLYGSLLERNSPDVNICTVEDPVKGPLPGVNQFQVNDAAGFTFAAALRALLRQDPDVVMVGELRDTETAKAATQAAMTSHLVLSMLHTHDAPSSITRLINLGVEPYLVSASLAGILAQRLVRKLCHACREPYAPTINERRILEKFGGSVETLYRPKGCSRCKSLGYSARIGVFELLTIEDTLGERIGQGASLHELRQLAHSLGLKTLRADGIEKVKAGITTLDEVFRVTA